MRQPHELFSIQSWVGSPRYLRLVGSITAMSDEQPEIFSFLKMRIAS